MPGTSASFAHRTAADLMGIRYVGRRKIEILWPVNIVYNSLTKGDFIHVIRD